MIGGKEVFPGNKAGFTQNDYGINAKRTKCKAL